MIVVAIGVLYKPMSLQSRSQVIDPEWLQSVGFDIEFVYRVHNRDADKSVVIRIRSDEFGAIERKDMLNTIKIAEEMAEELE